MTFFKAHDRNRTGDLFLTKEVLCRLSYMGDFNFKWSGKRDSNPRPSAWKADALPLSYSRILAIRADVWLPNSLRPNQDAINHAPATNAITNIWWRGKDSNLRRQSQRVYSPTPLATWVPLRTSLSWSHRRDSNPRPTDYKSVALPAELRWRQLINIKAISYNCQLKICCTMDRKMTHLPPFARSRQLPR